MKQIRLTENDLHKIISESVKKVLNELDSKTYMNAADKANSYGQADRGYAFLKHAAKTFDKETFEENNFRLLPDGFIIQQDHGTRGIAYDKDEDIIVDFNNDNVIFEPGDNYLRKYNRSLVRKIMTYFNKFAPDSRYNDKNLWIG